MRNMKTMNLTKLPYLSIESLIRLIFRFLGNTMESLLLTITLMANSVITITVRHNTSDIATYNMGKNGHCNNSMGKTRHCNNSMGETTVGTVITL